MGGTERSAHRVQYYFTAATATKTVDLGLATRPAAASKRTRRADAVQINDCLVHDMIPLGGAKPPSARMAMCDIPQQLDCCERSFPDELHVLHTPENIRTRQQRPLNRTSRNCFFHSRHPSNGDAQRGLESPAGKISARKPRDESKPSHHHCSPRKTEGRPKAIPNIEVPMFFIFYRLQ